MKIEILKASRSWSNESEGMNMAGCLAIDGRVACYFPTDSAMEHASVLSAAPELLAACKAAEDLLYNLGREIEETGGASWNPDFIPAVRNTLLGAIAKAERGAE